VDPAELRSVPLFEGLSDDDLARCAALFEERELLAGTPIIRETDFSYKFFVILEGEVEVRRSFEYVDRMGPGDFFGETGLITGARRNARVSAHTRCRLAFMLTWDFRAVTREFPEIARRIEDELNRRMGSPPDAG
jgi:CRP-like cAMP-binding protein